MSQSELTFPVEQEHVALPCDLEGRTHFAFLSKDRQRKDAFVDRIKEGHPGKTLIYLCPKAIRERAHRRHPEAVIAAIEQFTKTQEFLRINDYAGSNAVLVLENVSRYARLASDKFRCIHRLRKTTPACYWLDVVPFTQEVSKLYLPLSYLDRQILGYPHGYAFEENHYEEDGAGRERRAHEPAYLAEKMQPCVHLDYERFLPPISHVDTELTTAEKERYAKKKAQLFEKWNSPRKIVTRLADYTNKLGSRYDALAALVHGLEGPARVYFNLKSHAKKAGVALRKRGIDHKSAYATYTTHDNRPLSEEHVVFFETPINQNRMAALDVLADVAEGAQMYHFRSDAKVDQLVFREADDEWQSINALTKAIHTEQIK